jgi:hypothetical protein
LNKFYRERTNPEIIKNACREWYLRNSEKTREKSRVWKIQNPAKTNAMVAKRRAAKIKATPPWLTETQLNEIKEFYVAAKELSSLIGEDVHVDHIVPLQGDNVCGLHVPWNLQLLLAEDNLRKNKAVL